MKDRTEQEIGQVLDALGGVEAPLGLERRVLAGLAERRAQRRRGVLPGWTPALVLMGTCVLAGVVRVGVERLGPVHEVARVQQGANAEIRDAGRLQGREQRVGPAGGRVVTKRRQGVEATGSVRAAGAERGLQTQSGGAGAVSAEDRLAVEEMRAPSMPVAPLALTNQERLLIRVAQGKGAVGLAKQEGVELGASEGPETNDEGGEKAKPPVRREAARDIGTVLQAGLFAGMKAEVDE